MTAKSKTPGRGRAARAARGRLPVLVTLSPEAVAQLEELAESMATTKSAVVEEDRAMTQHKRPPSAPGLPAKRPGGPMDDWEHVDAAIPSGAGPTQRADMRKAFQLGVVAGLWRMDELFADESFTDPQRAKILSGWLDDAAGSEWWPTAIRRKP